MSLAVNTNLASLGAQTQLSKSQALQAQAIQRLSSGLRINSASDDAAGLAISQRFTTQLRGLNVAARNTQDAISLSQTADGSLSSIGDNLQRVRELAVQAANTTNSANDRAALQSEVSQLVQEIDRVARQANYNGQNLLDGSFTSEQFQVGANVGQTINVSGLASARAADLGGAGGQPLNISSNTLSSDAGITGPGQLIINGVDIYQGSSIEGSARGLAAAINAANISGLSATAAAATVTGTLNAGSPGVVERVVINGSAITEPEYDPNSFPYQSQASQVNYESLVINTYSSSTGVNSTDTGNGLQLSAADGRNIYFSSNSVAGGSNNPGGLGLGSIPGITFSHYDLAYTGIDGLVISGSASQAVTGLLNGNLGSPLVPPVSQIDVSTISGANSALASVDNALDAINSQRANLGALQNRFEAAVSNIESSSLNLSAARSRITDADFAAETARLASANVLQQASAALVAQANALPNNLLILLRA